MPTLHVTDRQGNTHTLDAVDGWRVMEILREHKIGLEGICGGSCACGSCHVIVAPEWAERLHPPREEELDRLDDLPVIEPTSRLSCQIIWAPDLEGLTLSIGDAG